MLGRAGGRARRAAGAQAARRVGAGWHGARQAQAQAGVHGARGQALQTAGREGAGRSGRAGVRSGRAAGAGKGARGGRLGDLCASGVLSWVRLGVLVHLTQFLAWFDSVFS